jgi:hypothetical protein
VEELDLQVDGVQSGLEAIAQTLVDQGVSEPINGYITFPLNYKSTLEEVGLRVLSVSPSDDRGRTDVLVGLGRCFLVKTYDPSSIVQGARLQEASIIGGILATRIGLALDHARECTPGVIKVDGIIGQPTIFQDEEISGSLRSLLAELGGQLDEYRQSTWVCQVLVKAKLIIS